MVSLSRSCFQRANPLQFVLLLESLMGLMSLFMCNRWRFSSAHQGYCRCMGTSHSTRRVPPGSATSLLRWNEDIVWLPYYTRSTTRSVLASCMFSSNWKWCTMCRCSSKYLLMMILERHQVIRRFLTLHSCTDTAGWLFLLPSTRFCPRLSHMHVSI